MPAPLSLTESAVADWLREVGNDGVIYLHVPFMARAVLALVEDRVREALALDREHTESGCECDGSGLGSAFHIHGLEVDAIVSRVLGRPA